MDNPSSASRRNPPAARNARRKNRTGESEERSGQRDRSRPNVDDRLGVLLRRDAAEELLDLIRDEEGDADEDLLDEATVALHAATPGRLPQVPRGMLVLRVRADERTALIALIGEQPTDEKRTTKIGDRLAQLLARQGN